MILSNKSKRILICIGIVVLESDLDIFIIFNW